VTTTDRLRPPPPLDARAAAYKDWLHVNLFDAAADRVALFNASLHGDPDDLRSLAVGTVVVADLLGELTAEVAVAELADVPRSPASVSVGALLGMSLDPDGIAVTARLPGATGSVEFLAEPTAPAITVDAPVPFGSGWIAWRALPRCAVSGHWSEGGEPSALKDTVAYHDHNWGRWHWGDDAGWEWAALLASDGTTVVMSRTTDRQHRTGEPLVHAVLGGRWRRFQGRAVTVGLHGRFDGDLLRLPGAMAALHGGRNGPMLPELVGVVADDGVDRIEVEFQPVHACQLITADPMVPGYGFIHELMGRFTYRGRVDGIDVAGSGLGVFEYVD
jgi:hypothetical protein